MSAPWPDTAALVVGLGVSGAAAAAALAGRGAAVRAVDPARTPAIDRRAAELAGMGVGVLRDDAAPAALLDGIDLVVSSPGVPPSAPLLQAAARRGVEVISEPELGWRLAGGRTRLVAVTGTNGKTSTTELLASCLAAPAAGNIGTPLTALLSAPEPPPLVVAELSSFQLWACSTLAPEVAVVLNLAPDHLDWHGSFVAYAAAKARIWQAQAPGGTAIVNADDAEASGLLEAHPPPARRAAFAVTPTPRSAGLPVVPASSVADGVLWWSDTGTGERVGVVEVADLAAVGPHQIANACAAVVAAAAAGADPAAIGEALRRYRPGPHRLERVAERGGVTWVNDSKATNPHAAAAALAAFPSVVWIAGGLNKGLAFDPLAPLLPGRVRAAVTIGTSGPAVAAVARSAGVPVVEAGTLEAAVPAAAEVARPGDTVLLAPACASMDQFADYAARGRAFADAVAALDRGGTGGDPAPVEGSRAWRRR